MVGSRLTTEQNLWLKRLRRGELTWQRSQRDLRRLTRAKRTSTASITIGGKRSRFVTRGFDALAETRRSLQAVRDALTLAGIEFVELPRLSPYRPHLVVKQSDVSRAVRAVCSLPDTDGWNIRCEGKSGHRLSIDQVAKTPERAFKIHAYRQLLAPNGRVLTRQTEWVTIEPWKRLGAGVPRIDGETHTDGTLQRRFATRDLNVEYLSPALWERSLANGNRLDWPAPHLYQITEPIDLVYAWVDGADEAWQRRKHDALRRIDPDNVNETALSDSRFQSREELKYSLRSVESYANWVNQIYIVTDGQVPSWLDTDHPKITVIDHSEIFANTAHLPVFNSHAIESQLHHISGLNEHYIYMNDDIFFLRPVDPELFFTSNGLSKFFPSTASLDIDGPSARDLPVLSAAKHGREFVLAEHGRTVTNKFRHTPHPQLRSRLTAMEERYPELFDRVAASKFRHPDDFSIASSLYHFHAYALTHAIPGTIAYGYLDLANSKAPVQLDWNLNRSERQVLCVNDTDLADNDDRRVTKMFVELMDERFPIPSSFEKPDVR